eukprot:NODE_467_length_7071_cov_0.830752.p5 type:complete len:134 gc:universal NODE_467_length_7071_cov_0.830752:4059-3658(-)
MLTILLIVFSKHQFMANPQMCQVNPNYDSLEIMCIENLLHLLDGTKHIYKSFCSDYLEKSIDLSSKSIISIQAINQLAEYKHVHPLNMMYQRCTRAPVPNRMKGTCHVLTDLATQNGDALIHFLSRSTFKRTK